MYTFCLYVELVEKSMPLTRTCRGNMHDTSHHKPGQTMNGGTYRKRGHGGVNAEGKVEEGKGARELNKEEGAGGLGNSEAAATIVG